MATPRICPCCRKQRTPDQFFNDFGRPLKSCKRCREKKRKYQRIPIGAKQRGPVPPSHQERIARYRMLAACELPLTPLPEHIEEPVEETPDRIAEAAVMIEGCFAITPRSDP